MAEEIESRIEDGGSDGAEGSALNDIESVTDFFDSMDGEKGGDSEGGADGSENGEGVEAPAEGSEGEAEEQAMPASVMPEGWEEAMWSGLAPEVQAVETTTGGTLLPKYSATCAAVSAIGVQMSPLVDERMKRHRLSRSCSSLICPLTAPSMARMQRLSSSV